MRRFLIFICIPLLLISISCQKSQVNCKAPDENNPELFTDCPYGSGSFGKWIIDEHGLPAYEYTLDQEKDDRALWWNSSQRDRREHWHQIGNDRFIATAFNEGYIQVFTEENGFKWLNFYNEDEKNYAGGFSFIDDGDEIWSTAYKFKPEGARTRRVFGLDYFQTETEYNGISVTRRTFAPYGDDPLLISEIEIQNKTDQPREITHYEYWDMNIHQMLLMLLSSGVLDPGIPGKNEEQRTLFNKYFQQSVRIDSVYGAGVIDTSLKFPEANELKIPAPVSAREFDDSPPSIFLVPLDSTGSNEGFVFSQDEFFGAGDARRPEFVSGLSRYQKDNEIPAKLKNIPASGQPFALIHVRRLTIGPQEIAKLRYGYGYYRNQSNTLNFISNYINFNDNLIALTLKKWREKLAYFVPDRDYYLHREMAWHSYYLESASFFREYLKTHVVSQGGEYLYGHGADGATRDYCIFSIPLTYLNPDLAKETLKFVMMTTKEDGEMAYSNYGDTVVTGAVIYSQPSDLDIFFLWAMAEYLMATRDFDFLNERVPFYQPDHIFDSPTSTTVLDHIRTAFEHLVNVVGVGEHGLIRLRTGDWSDGITWFTENPSLAEEKGESAFNTAFASAILPWIADAISSYDSSLAKQMGTQAETYRIAMQNQWWGQWFLRGWQGNGKPFGDDRIFLEPQVWALIGGIPDPERAEVLLNSIRTILDANSPIGARILFPPKEDIFGGLLPGTDVNGGIWHATNSLLTWAYSLYSHDYAWESLKKNTLASHAEAYPDLWYGIWSGPDSFNSPESERPGEASAHYATALTDHPVMNMNQHANPLLAMIKIAGITPKPDGISFFPRLPLKKWSLSLPLLGISFKDKEITGYYNRLKPGIVRISLLLPEEFLNSQLKVIVNNAETPYILDNNTLSFVANSLGRIEWKIEQ